VFVGDSYLITDKAWERLTTTLLGGSEK
jgi:hypothetical protein